MSYPGIQELELIGCVWSIMSFNLINIFFVGFNLKSVWRNTEQIYKHRIFFCVKILWTVCVCSGSNISKRIKQAGLKTSISEAESCLAQQLDEILVIDFNSTCFGGLEADVLVFGRSKHKMTAVRQHGGPGESREQRKVA